MNRLSDPEAFPPCGCPWCEPADENAWQFLPLADDDRPVDTITVKGDLL